eukprot:Clim_evm26s199 gene=Clim_evmTU26s199
MLTDLPLRQVKVFSAKVATLNIVDRIEAKIKAGNTPSMRLFEKAGFVFVKENPVFQEVIYEAPVSHWKGKEFTTRDYVPIGEELKK